ncbi:MAG: hypothetical protein PHU23_17190 [Dehalococcoidales bacterium]|nr:hypothetical protein [Dehalococcoidales bacterium]
MLNWDKALKHLEVCEKAYSEIGSPGYIALNMFIRPLRDRVNKGERTTELFHEIMELSL